MSRAHQGATCRVVTYWNGSEMCAVVESPSIIIAHGDTRDEALESLAASLEAQAADARAAKGE